MLLALFGPGETSRRAFLGAVGLGVICVACGTSPPGTGTPAASAAGTIRDTLHGAGSVAAADRVPDAALQRLATAWNGTWKGRWITAQGKGTATVSFTLDLARRVATMDLQVDGVAFGKAPLPHLVTDVFLDGYSYLSSDISYTIDGIGSVVIHRGGGGTGTGTLTRPVFDTTVDKVDVTASYLEGRGADMTYQCTLRDGSSTLGAVRWSRTGDAFPQLPTSAASGLEAFVHGDYAAGLLTATELTAAVGQNLGPLTANGGRAHYAPGVDVSNARAGSDTGGGAIVQISIYRLATPAAAQAYFTQTYSAEMSASNTIAGLGDSAFVQPSVPDVLVLQGREIADIQVLNPALDVDLEKAVAAALLKRLGRSP